MGLPLDAPPLVSVTSEMKSGFAQIRTPPSKTLRSGVGFHSRTRSLFSEGGALTFYDCARDGATTGEASYQPSSLAAGGAGNPIASASSSLVSSPRVDGQGFTGWHAEQGSATLKWAFGRARGEGTALNSGAGQGSDTPVRGRGSSRVHARSRHHELSRISHFALRYGSRSTDV